MVGIQILAINPDKVLLGAYPGSNPTGDKVSPPVGGLAHEHSIAEHLVFFSGYSRHLPGYDRYRMLGDPGSGVHDLEVTNVTLEDDGRFQCQVSPNRGQDAIRADAILTVLGKSDSDQTFSFVYVRFPCRRIFLSSGLTFSSFSRDGQSR